MANTNRMGALLNKAERKLGLAMVNLPPQLSKNTWADVVIEDSLTEFSRLFPQIIEYKIDMTKEPMKDGFYMIDEDRISGYFYMGIQDIDYSSLARDNRFYTQQMGIGQVDYLSMQAGIGMEDFAMAQMGADMSGLFNNGIFIETKGDNMFKICNALGYDMKWLRICTLKLRVKHSESLNTISAGMMTIFEQLCFSDIATYLYNNLKFFDGQDTGYGSIDLKMDLLEQWMNKKDEIMAKLEEASVSASNDACPIMWTI